MKNFRYIFIMFTALCLMNTGCDLDRFPESQFSDADFWNNESDLLNACNRLYQQLDAEWIDNRADDNTNTTLNTVSNGNRSVPNTSGDWNDRYDEIFTANNILEKGQKANVSDEIKNRYFAEARFFRAYAYFKLVKLYGDVPLLLKTLESNSPELYMARTPRAQVMQAIYADLDFAAIWLPSASALPAAQYGRVTKSTAWALEARAGLYEGTRAKYHNDGDPAPHLKKAITAAENVMGQGHVLFGNYGQLFDHAGEGPNNKENIFVKIYGVNNTNLILGHNNSRDLENGRKAVTRNLIREYLYTDGLPAWNTNNTLSTTKSALFVPEANESSYNQILENRDPRLTYTVFLAGEQAYKGPWTPTVTLGAKTGYASKKGFNTVDQTINGAATVDRILIRYGEVLITYAEAKYELDGNISDADLERTVNKLRGRAGFNVKLTNAFVNNNNLNMLEEIRRERTVELALEGFRYDDLIRWKTAETVLPKALLGAKYVAADWPNTKPTDFNLNADNVIVVEDASKRTFQVNRDYLYPIPVNEIALSNGNVVPNPNW